MYKILKQFICEHCRTPYTNAYKDNLETCEVCGNKLKEIKPKTDEN